MYYKLENIISEEHRHQLLDVYNSLPSELAHQDYNLFDVDKRHPGKEDSFHTDNDDAVGLTIVTFLDKSDDLIGGEALAMLPYTKRERPSNKYRKGDAPIDERVIPKVINMNVGQSLVYDKSLMHGVGQVERGSRLVLISWYGNPV